MFTGLIEEVGRMDKISKGEKSLKLTIVAQKVLEDIKIGDSISTNGVCLTVVEYTNNSFTVDVMPETLRNTNLGQLEKGSILNLERALQLSDRIGGHIVSGHIDGIGNIVEFKVEDNATWITIETTRDVIKYILPKGSIAIDGTSLTVVDVKDNSFRVSIIPITKDETTLLKKSVGDEVNLECDMVGKYIERFLNFKEDKQSTIDLDFLEQNGYL